MFSNDKTSEARPWGYYEILRKEEGLWVKRIEVDPGKRLSLQKHFKRSEKWVVTRGEGEVHLGQQKMIVRAGSFIDVPVGTVHRIANTGKQSLVFIEIAFGDYLAEDDIVRLEDDYHRT